MGFLNGLAEGLNQGENSAAGQALKGALRSSPSAAPPPAMSPLAQDQSAFNQFGGPGSTDAINQSIQGMADQAQLPDIQMPAQGGLQPQHADAIAAGIQALAAGGLVTPHPPMPANFGSSQKGYQQGGPVKAENYGIPTNRPDFTRPRNPGGIDSQQVGHPPATPAAMAAGGAVPQHGTSMGQGITPAPTEGILHFDQGGGVPDMGMPPSGTNMMGVPGQGAPPMIGRAAGISAGLAPGMAMGHNLVEQYHQMQQRRDAVNANNEEGRIFDQQYRQAHPEMQAARPDSDNPVENMRNHISNFFDHLVFHSHDSDGKHGNAQLAQDAGVTPGATAGSPVPSGAGAQGQPAGAGAPAQGAPAAASPAPPPGLARAGDPASGVSAVPGQAPSPAATPASQAGATAVKTSLSAGAAPQAAQAAGQAVTKGVQNASAVPATSATAAQQAPPAHSMRPQDVLAMEHAMRRAANSATMAGMDGTKVYAALKAQQTAHFQGEYMQQMALAQRALDNGDMDAVKKFMNNANYYLPNGQDMEFKTADQVGDKNLTARGITGDTPVVKNPFYGMPGHNDKDEPQWVPLNSMTLGHMAQGAMDPRQYASLQQGMYQAGVEAEAKITTAKAAEETAQGRWMWGQSFQTRAAVDAAMAPSRENLNNANAEKARSMALYYQDKKNGTGGGLKIPASQLTVRQKAGESAFRSAAQGELETQGQTITINGKTEQNITGTAGKSAHNPEHIDPVYKNLNPQEMETAAATAGNIAGANINMSPTETSRAAALLTKAESFKNAHGGTDDNYGTHYNKDTKQNEKDVVKYNDIGEDGKPHMAMRVWDASSNKYIHMWVTPNVQQDTGLQMNMGGGTPSAPGASGEEHPEGWQPDDDKPA